MESGERRSEFGLDRDRHIRIVFLFLLALVVFGTGVTVAQEAIWINDLSVDEGAVVETEDGVHYLWQSDAQTIDVIVETGPASGEGHYEICLTATLLETGSARELDCRETVLSGAISRRVTFQVDHWPDGLVGRQTVTAVVHAGTLTREPVANTSLPVHVLERGADIDGDGLTNVEEMDAGTEFDAADTDRDGLNDSLELRTYGTDPMAADSDGDGLTDGEEVFETGTDPTDPDTDGDALKDSTEIRRTGTEPTRADTDGDGLDDSTEVNTHGTDPKVPDTDADGLDDRVEVESHGTDPTVGDTDGDGLADPLEVYTYRSDPNKADTDADGLDDGSEVYDARTDPTNADSDGDGVKDGPERNTYGTNPNRADTDGDGLNDGAEIREHDTDPTVADTDGDGLDDRSEVAASTSTVPVWYLLGLMLGVGLAVAVGWFWIRHRGVPARAGEYARALPWAVDQSESANDRGDHDSADEAAFLGHDWEYVLELLGANGGRMKQSRIVDETGWSKAKVSRVLMKMEEDDRVIKITVGRENIIALPGAEPERSRRPFAGEDIEGFAK